MRPLLTAILILCAASGARAQFTEVRRAEPVSTPAGMPSAPPDPGFSPVADAPLDATATPPQPEVRRAEPVTTPAVPVAPEAAGDVIRAAPTTAGMDPAWQAFEQANGFFARKMFDLAAPKYEEFLNMRPSGNARQAALFRLADSLRNLDRKAEAMPVLQQLLAESNSGEFIGPAAYRLGEMQYAARQFEPAARSFRIAALHVRDPQLRLAARFFEGRALDGAGRKLEAIAVYRDLAAEKGNNPYRERAMFDLAESDARTGLVDSAFRQFRSLAETATNPVLRVSSSVKAGLLAIDAKDYKAARPLLESAAANREVAAWSLAARVGLVRLDYEEGFYEKAAQDGQVLLPLLPSESRPEVLLLTANALRQTGRAGEALVLYDRLKEQYPDSAAAKEAGFHRLVSLVAQKDERAMAQIDAFLQASGDQGERSRAQLLKAEMLFEQARYDEAAELYGSAASSVGIGKYRADALYKLAWCQMQQKKYDQVTRSLTSFLQQYPRHPQAASALIQRGLAQLQTGDQVAALADFEAVIASHPEAREREAAMLQAALLLGQLKRSPEMVAMLQRLLAEYPETKSAAQANYWIGYALFDDKKFAEAVTALEVARTADAKDYGEKATLRLLLAHYYLEDRGAAMREARALGVDKAPAEVRGWLGLAALDQGDHGSAIEFLAPLAAAPDATEEVRLALARAQLQSRQFAEARTTLEKMVPQMHEPKAKARAHLLLAEALIGLNEGAKAKLQAEEAQRLQPEGRLNAEARIANGKALAAQDRFEDAARAFMAVALLYDEKDLTPQALVLAEQAYRQANNTADADRAREELQRRYPDFKPSA